MCFAWRSVLTSDWFSRLLSPTHVVGLRLMSWPLTPRSLKINLTDWVNICAAGPDLALFTVWMSAVGTEQRRWKEAWWDGQITNSVFVVLAPWFVKMEIFSSCVQHDSNLMWKMCPTFHLNNTESSAKTRITKQNVVMNTSNVGITGLC